ncbi:aspartyl-phosphate phosphatase Spo0E family protein [Clostridium ihumii]|nr:aspartyl-phosphate phosphatase Spo0E family protein [Clostridium ihumii]
MEDLRESMYRAIELYGLLDSRTIYISEQLDKLVVKEQKKYERKPN